MNEKGSQIILASWESGACINNWATEMFMRYLAFMGIITTCFRSKLELLKSCELFQSLFWRK
jgi:hypothetical protein